MAFCSKCGKELVNGQHKGFSKETGEQIFKKTCPSGICGHDGVQHEFRDLPRSVFDRVFGTNRYFCFKCGASHWDCDSL